jgi:hypothetical protein
MKFVNRQSVPVHLVVKYPSTSGTTIIDANLRPNEVREYRLGQPPVASGNPANVFVTATWETPETFRITDDTTVVFATEFRSGILS